MTSVTELAIGRELRCRGALCGVVTFVVWDLSIGRVTFLVVQPEGHEAARLVPAGRTIPAPQAIEFDGTPAEFQSLEEADERRFLRNTERDWGDRSDHVLVWSPAAAPAR